MARGRPALAPEKRRKQIGVRLSDETKGKLEQAAAANQWSLAREVEYRLMKSLEGAN